MDQGLHMGLKLRNARLLLGIKQSTFARLLGITQQNVSKMEKKKDISIEKLEAAAKALGISVQALKDFDEKAIFNNNFAFEPGAGQVVHPVKDVIEYFKEELGKKEKTIEALRRELEAYRSGRKKPVKKAVPVKAKKSSKSNVAMRSVSGR